MRTFDDPYYQKFGMTREQAEAVRLEYGDGNIKAAVPDTPPEFHAARLAEYAAKLIPHLDADRYGDKDEHAAWVAGEYFKRTLAAWVLSPHAEKIVSAGK